MSCVFFFFIFFFLSYEEVEEANELLLDNFEEAGLIYKRRETRLCTELLNVKAELRKARAHFSVFEEKVVVLSLIDNSLTGNYSYVDTTNRTTHKILRWRCNEREKDLIRRPNPLDSSKCTS